MPEYYALGSHKRLSEIIFTGSHDASITGGSANAQTQTLDIAGQAGAGVRFFDLRILARTVRAADRTKKAEFVGYHGSARSSKKRITYRGHQYKEDKVASRMALGTFGLSLGAMLDQARVFVTNTSSNEFLIFKFDKCTNYHLITNFCVDVLGPSIYTDGGDLGRKTLQELKGKVICIFPENGLKEVIGLGAGHGILGWNNLNGKEGTRFKKKSVVKGYEDNYDGLQYFGKGGTSPFSGGSKESKMKENEKKQAKLAKRMGDNAADYGAYVLGMMYWTSTGMAASIKNRNNAMWNDTGVARMEALWNEALRNSIGVQLARESVLTRESGGVKRLKTHFPNIIMIDFADPGKCKTIYDLNTAKDQKLAAAYNSWHGEG